jgi:hypothetical protein
MKIIFASTCFQQKIPGKPRKKCFPLKIREINKHVENIVVFMVFNKIKIIYFVLVENR